MRPRADLLQIANEVSRLRTGHIVSRDSTQYLVVSG